MFRNRSANVHDFAMVPAADVPRSVFLRPTNVKSAFNSGDLVPIYVDEVLPGDAFRLKMTAFTRLATPLVPVMDNLKMDSFFFFVPLRLVWDNFKKMMGEQNNPADSISYTCPISTSPASGYAVGSLQDYMGLPTVGQVGGGNTFNHNVFHLRAYNLIWNEWFRDENLQNSVVVDKDDGPDTPGDYVLLKRGKRKDYFTGALPWPQKGNTAVSLPLGVSAAVKTSGTEQVTGAQASLKYRTTAGGGFGSVDVLGVSAATPGDAITGTGVAGFTPAANIYPSNLYADLSTATAATINQLRQAFQIQRLLERDARGGTRYTEIVRSHFRVVSPDARLQRPEYLGGGSSFININPVPQTSATGLTGGSTPAGNLAAVGQGVLREHGFSQSFTEHGVIIGLVSVRADLNYQQGLRRMWSRSTRYDFYWPAFQALGEQSILNKEIYCRGDANDDLTFGYQERHAEYRYFPSMITGLMRSTSASTIDFWHLAQKFTALPTLGDTFIKETPPVQRILAVGSGAAGQEFLFDAAIDIRSVRPMPMYGVPGLMDHF